jgi:hypothetical protein
MNYYICCWHKNTDWACTQQATQFITFGCLDGHVSESVFCFRHALEWKEKYQEPSGFRCSCKLKIEDFELVPLMDVKHPHRLRSTYP